MNNFLLKPARQVDPVATARDLAPLVERYALKTEAGGTLAPDVVEAFREAGLFALLVPEDLGGQDADVLTTLAVWEEISRADASSGWSLMANGLATGIAAAFLSEEAIDRMFGQERMPVMAGMAGPGGTAVEQDGGIRGSGKYQFASGGLHSDWLCAGMLIAEGEGVRKLPNGSPETQVCFIPRDEIEMLSNWDVSGLCGTGSVDYLVKDRFIKNGFSVERSSTNPRRGRGTFKLGIAGMGILGHASVALGLAKRALEEISVIATRRKRPHYKGVLAEHPVFRHDFALNDAAYMAIRALAAQALKEAEDAAMRGGGVTPLQLARLRQMVIYVHNVASDVVRFCHVQGGSDSLRNPSVLGRCMRDMHAATQHVFVDSTYLVDVAGPILKSRQSEIAG